MYEKLQNKVISKEDLDENLKDFLDQIQRSFNDMIMRFPQDISYQTIISSQELQTEENFKTRELINQVALSINSQINAIHSGNREDREHFQTELMIADKKRRREQFE